MSVPKLSYKESLENLVSTEKCVGCGACVAVCPLACLEYGEEGPAQIKDCNACGICQRVCPRYDFSMSDLEKLVFERERKPEEDFGVYRRIILAQSNDKKVLNVCQDGGLVTTLLTYALENGIIDGAAISGVSKERPLYPIPILASKSEDVLKCAGTRYAYSPNLLAYQEGVKAKMKSLALVGTPCQIHAIRRIQMVPLKKYSNPLKFTIGLMCTESFTYNGLNEGIIQGELGIDLHDVKKVNIKGKILVTTRSGKVESISLKEAKRSARKSCTICTDFSGELADISAGGLGLNNQTFTIIRTKIGEEIFDEAEKKGLLNTEPVKEEMWAHKLLLKLSKRKRKV